MRISFRNLLRPRATAAVVILSVVLVAVFFLVVPDLSILWAAIAAGVVAILGGGIFWSVSNLSRLTSEDAFERSELKGIVAVIEDALVVYDERFRVSFFNAAAENLFGLAAEEVVGREIQPQDAENPRFTLLTQAMFPSIAPAFTLYSRTGEYPQVVELSFDHPFLALRVITAPIRDEEGKSVGFVKIVRNRTSELTLIKSKNEFVALASHQLRTPINEITWALESLEGERGLTETGRAVIQGMGVSARKLINIVEDLLNISRIEEGRLGYAFESTDLVAFLGDMLASAEPQARRAGLDIYFDRPAESLPQVMIDRKKLSMVISNLVDNAIRYNVKDGKILVTARKSEGKPFLEVSVKDTGIGIPPEEVQKLFGKFFRGANAIKYETEGAGLGLYIARSIVRAHGGEMWAESELNRGSTFFFTVPTDSALVPTKEVPMGY